MPDPTPRRATEERPTVAVLAAAPSLLLVIERGRDGGVAEVHLHPGGQGFWAARMAARLGAHVTLVGPFDGESGTALRALVEAEGIAVRAVGGAAPNPVLVTEGHEGEEATVAHLPAGPLPRHVADGLVNAMLAAGLEARVSVLTGAPDGVIDARRYAGIAHDLHAVGGTLVADLAGEQMEAALEGGLDVLKVAHDEIDDGLGDPPRWEDLAGHARRLRERGADTVVVSRAEEPLLALVGDELMRVETPALREVNHRGAGDSMTGALAAALARGEGRDGALRWAVAAGALNVTRRGLGSGDSDAILRLAERARIVRLAPAAP